MEFQTQDIALQFDYLKVKLTVIENLDALFDALIAKGENHPDVLDERIPYWAELWASALAMSEYLVDNQSLVAGKSVLEIGCGLGLPSIVAGKLGASAVTLSDYLPDALDFAKLNWQQNLPMVNATFIEMDWRNIPPSVSADVLLASDVAYESRAFEHLLRAFDTLLKPNGIILITEPNRPVSKTFFKHLDTEGYMVRHFEKQIERKGHFFTINIFELSI